MDIPEGKPGYRVFIVEDNELYAKVLKKKLENKRYEVSAFYTGRECLNNLDMKPSIVTLDYRLPDI
ncbi:MAG TPA: response regulator, partial [Prolixibacteraceae bacterium]|nr:response regulator [Prolixibacteraceae bacterium]